MYLCTLAKTEPLGLSTVFLSILNPDYLVSFITADATSFVVLSVSPERGFRQLGGLGGVHSIMQGE